MAVKLPRIPRLHLGGPASWRRVLRGVNSLAAVLSITVLLIVVNAVAALQQARWDLSETKAFTLAPQTVELLQQLDQDVTIYAFIKRDTDTDRSGPPLLEAYRAKTPRLEYRIIDPDQHPAEAKEFGVTQYDNIIVKTASGRQSRGSAVNEVEITGALLRALRKQGQAVYFLEGHGEHRINESLRQGYSELRAILEREGYMPKAFRMLNGEPLPADAAVLVVAGPKQSLLPAEQDSVRRYLQRGGRVAVLADPQINTGLEGVLAEWGVTLGEGVVVDQGSRTFGGSFTLPLVTIYTVHDIVRELRLPTLFPEARPIQIDLKNQTYVGMALAQTSNQSWAELTPAASPPSFDEQREQKGPFAVAIASQPRDAVQDLKNSPRLIVVGDSDFLVNLYINFSGNRDIFLNMLNWLVQGLDTFTVRPHDAKVSPIILSERQSQLLFAIPVVVLPLVVMCTGWTVWWYRRSRV